MALLVAGARAFTGRYIHTLGPVAVLALALWSDAAIGRDVGLIWLAHVGFDRVLGDGLKYPSAFGDMHLGRIGAAKSQAALLSSAIDASHQVGRMSFA